MGSDLKKLHGNVNEDFMEDADKGIDDALEEMKLDGNMR